MPLEDAFIDQAAARPVHEMLVHEMLQRIGRNSSAELGPDPSGSPKHGRVALIQSHIPGTTGQSPGCPSLVESIIPSQITQQVFPAPAKRTKKRKVQARSLLYMVSKAIR